MDLLDTQLYSLVGEETFRRLVNNFYKRVPSDEVLGAMYPKHDLAAAEDRLLGFLIQRFGGPDTYSQQRGHPRLRMRPAPFHINQAARDRWVALMHQALDETEMPAEARVVFSRFFHDSATFLIN